MTTAPPTQPDPGANQEGARQGEFLGRERRLTGRQQAAASLSTNSASLAAFRDADIEVQTGEITESLTVVERSALVHAEATIERGLTSFMEVGEALSRVRDERLYREGFGTFEVYCRDRWGITDRRARQMIDAATVVDTLPTGTTVPVNEGQARELVGLAPDAAAEVMHRADQATGGHVTAAAIREVRAPKTAPRRALPDQFFDAAFDLTKVVERVDRLINDNRFPQNAEKVAAKHRIDLLRAVELLSKALVELTAVGADFVTTNETRQAMNVVLDELARLLDVVRANINAGSFDEQLNDLLDGGGES